MTTAKPIDRKTRPGRRRWPLRGRSRPVGSSAPKSRPNPLHEALALGLGCESLDYQSRRRAH